MEDKASYGVGLNSVQAWGCPCFIKCITKDIRSPLTLSPLPLSLFLYNCCFGNKQTDTDVLNQYERSPLLHPFPFDVGVES
jgi:hypothetical protein